MSAVLLRLSTGGRADDTDESLSGTQKVSVLICAGTGTPEVMEVPRPFQITATEPEEALQRGHRTRQ